MSKFRKRPVVIEAMQYLNSNKDEIERFVGTNLEVKLLSETAYVAHMGPPLFTLMIPTLESPHEANPGDWIIKGVNGEFYPCKPDIFEKTYKIAHDCDRKVTNSLFTTKYTEVYGGNEVFNALHDFEVRGKAPASYDGKETGKVLAEIHFQEGPIKECGVNGVCNEDLLLMVITRLQMFQDSPYKCRENAVAITKLEEAIMWLRKRTLDREARDVEGTSIV